MRDTAKIINTKVEADEFIFNRNPNATKPRFLVHVSARIPKYPCRIAYCSDEKTGTRFGNAKIRRDKNPIKIGGGGRNRGSYQAYQLWTWEV